MPYLHSILVVGAKEGISFAIDGLIAEVGSPIPAEIRMHDEYVQGVRYLVLSHEPDGYLSGMTLVYLPADAEEPARLHIPDRVSNAYLEILNRLLTTAPTGRIASYLEANGVISHRDSRDPFQVQELVYPQILRLGEYLGRVAHGKIVEETIYLVEK